MLKRTGILSKTESNNIPIFNKMDSPKIKIDDIKELRDELLNLYKTISHYQAVKWVHNIISSVINLCEYEEETFRLVKHCLDYIDEYQEGFSRIKEVRSLAFKIHFLARKEKSLTHKFGLRAIGHAISTIHVKNHALVASDYLIKLVNTLYPGNLEIVRIIRLNQIKTLKNPKAIKKEL